MCRNIRILFNFAPPVTEDEIRAASLQFVRKVSGFNKPSKANEAAFVAAGRPVGRPVCRYAAPRTGYFRKSRTAPTTCWLCSRCGR